MKKSEWSQLQNSKYYNASEQVTQSKLVTWYNNRRHWIPSGRKQTVYQIFYFDEKYIFLFFRVEFKNQRWHLIFITRQCLCSCLAIEYEMIITLEMMIHYYWFILNVNKLDWILDHRYHPIIDSTTSISHIDHFFNFQLFEVQISPIREFDVSLDFKSII